MLNVQNNVFFFIKKLYMFNVDCEEIHLNMQGGQKKYSMKNVSMWKKYATSFTSMIEIKLGNAQIIQLLNM